MLKMIDVLDQRLVQNFTQALQSPTPQFEEQLNQSILNASDLDLNHAVTTFFNEVDAIEVVQALDISADRIQALQPPVVLSQQGSVVRLSQAAP